MVVADNSIEHIWTLLDQVKDPEIPIISIVELGIAREVLVADEEIKVVITPTYSGCPAMREIESDIKTVLADHGYPEVVIKTILSPAWTTDWISKRGSDKLREYGIAPPQPVRSAANSATVVALQPHIRCPRCDSLQTRQISEFGSTACKALYQCRSCLEPFDYFKPL